MNFVFQLCQMSIFCSTLVLADVEIVAICVSPHGFLKLINLKLICCTHLSDVITQQSICKKVLKLQHQDLQKSNCCKFW